MGAHGLLNALREHGAPRPVRLPLAPAGGAAAPGGAGRVLLVDASGALHHVAAKLGAERVGVDAAGDVHAAAFAATTAFCATLQRAGLRLVCFTDNGVEPAHAAVHCSRRVARVAEGAMLSPAGVEVHHALRCADRALLAYYRRHAADVFAILTGDSDFLVYGDERVILFQELAEEHDAITVYMLPCAEAWAAWRRVATGGSGGGSGGAVPLLQRAQVAALLGNDASREVRARLAGRRASSAVGAGVRLQRGTVRSAYATACEALKLPPGEPFAPAFFRAPLGLRSWSDEDQAEFVASVARYLRDTADAAQGGAPWASMTVCAAALPAICPLAVAALPPSATYLRYATCGGMFALFGSEAEAAAAPALRRVRAAAAAALFPAGGCQDVYEFDPRANRLCRLLARDAAALPPGAGWFRPAEHLPGVAVSDAAATLAAQAPPAWATRAATAADVAAAHPALPPSFAAMYAALAAFAARDGAQQLRPAPARDVAADAPVPQLAAARLDDAEEPDDWETLA